MFDGIKNLLAKARGDSSALIRMSTLVYAGLVVLIIVFIGSLIAVYVPARPYAFAERLKNTLPYPIAVIGYGDGITYRTLSQNMSSIRLSLIHI